MIDQAVNTIIGVFCILSVAKLIWNHANADPDEKVALRFILVAMILLTAFNFTTDSLTLWIEIFLSVICGLMMHWLYKEYRKIFKFPSRIFMLTSTGLTLLAVAIEIIF